jgi:hypothetical protein
MLKRALKFNEHRNHQKKSTMEDTTIEEIVIPEETDVILPLMKRFARTYIDHQLSINELIPMLFDR